jgi:hypothetical protein
MNTINVKDMMSISGKGGLFRFIAQARNGVVVESLQDMKRHVAPATARISSLEDIAIFTTEEDMPLSDVFMKVHEKEEGGACIDSKSSNEELKSYFSEVLPDYDDERVYVSDIKKVITWYNQLQQLKLLEIIEVDADTEQASEEGSEDQKAAPKEENKTAPKEEKKDK